MTYIISGKFKNNPFLMVDCVAIGEKDIGKTYQFRNKLKKLISTENETYFCLTGSELYQHAIQSFDEKYHWSGEKFNIENSKHIEEILEIFKLICDIPNYRELKIDSSCRIYFMDKNDVYFYNIDNNLNLSDMFKIPNNKFIKPDDYLNTPFSLNKTFENKEEIIEFCKNEILKLRGYNGLDFKDKFSYVAFDEEGKLINNSMKTNSEIILSMIAGDYNEIT